MSRGASISLERADRDSLLLGDVILEQYDAAIPRLMRQIFDAVWNAGGYNPLHEHDRQRADAAAMDAG